VERRRGCWEVWSGRQVGCMLMMMMKGAFVHRFCLFVDMTIIFLRILNLGLTSKTFEYAVALLCLFSHALEICSLT
jgi:hypothetical protein